MFTNSFDILLVQYFILFSKESCSSLINLKVKSFFKFAIQFLRYIKKTRSNDLRDKYTIFLTNNTEVFDLLDKSINLEYS